MSRRAVAPASLPPPGLPGLDPDWSRLVTTPGLDGGGRTWHVLDNGVVDADLTVLCVHGNPTWSYLWRNVVAGAPANVRVVAVDQLDMGFSERTGRLRRLRQRVDDLDAVVEALQIGGPVVTLAHDWGGPISLGWAIRHVDRLAGVVLLNTAVNQPPGSPAPALIRAARLPGVLPLVAQRTTTFIDRALALSRPPIPEDVRNAYRSPYRSWDRRAAIRDFVADIPLAATHPSYEPLEGIAGNVEALAKVPALLLWGPRDPVFADRYLNDLRTRLPHAAVHRFEAASHFVSEDADVAGTFYQWLAQLDATDPAASFVPDRRPAWAGLEDRAQDESTASVEMGDGSSRSLTFAELNADVRRIGAGLVEFGVRPGDRVGLLVPPGLDLTAVIYACWRIGAVVVVVDAGLGARGIGRALRSADPDVLVGVPRALAAARTLRWPGRRILVGGARRAAALGAIPLDQVRARGEGRLLPEPPRDLAPAAVAFTSGSTGPAKGVAYRHHQLQAQRDALMELFDITPADRLVAAFAPFALYGPAMGIPSVVPDMDVTAPGTLTARALGDAVRAIEATLVFASPAALANVIATQDGLTAEHRTHLANVRVVMSAGAPIPLSLLESLVEVLPNAEPHTPYGMTEVLPVADITLADARAAGDGRGVCVGTPLEHVDVSILPIDALGRTTDTPTTEPEVVGEVCVRAPHMKDGYDNLWATQTASARPAGWHRSGDVGHFDEEGRLWIEGRTAHLIVTADGPVTPVGLEHAAERVPDVRQAAAVGVGPVGTQHVVLVVTPASGTATGLAPLELCDRIRAAVDVDVAAILVAPKLPTDKRHNSKIERARIAVWAGRVLAGERVGRL